MLTVLKHQGIESSACKDDSIILDKDLLRLAVTTMEVLGQIFSQESLLQAAGLVDSLQSASPHTYHSIHTGIVPLGCS